MCRTEQKARTEKSFHLLDVVTAVYATATWLGGWVAGCLSHAGILSKRLNLS